MYFFLTCIHIENPICKKILLYSLLRKYKLKSYQSYYLNFMVGVNIKSSHCKKENSVTMYADRC